ncbi:cell wall hydrolase [Sphingomonas sp. IW22]
MRAALTLLAVIAILAPLVIVMTAPRITAQPRVAIRRPQRVVPKAVLPPVEPALFVPVDPSDARAYNASIPFSTAPLLSARPFRIVGDADSVARATDCLTAGVLYEAGDDPVGQRPVAQVILNRLRHPAFPKTICEVVFQGSERQTGCQFTFTCDGALARRYSDAAWRRARDVATAALTGRVEKAVGMATHYHTDWVVPYWSASLDKVSEVHSHLFFRWTGWWGTPPAFRGRYRAAEPLIAKLRGIAPAHSSTADDPGEQIADAAIAIAPDAVPQPSDSDPNLFLLTLDPKMAPAQHAAVAQAACGTRPYCKLMARTDQADTPAALPADPRRIERLAFSYLRDRQRGFDKALWDCTRFQRIDPSECMKPRLPAPATKPVPPAPAAGAIPSATAAPVTELDGVRRRSGPATAPAVTTAARPAAAPQ